jgi:hypothetical protein
METNKVFAVRVTQSNQFSRKFLVEAKNGSKAKQLVIDWISEIPLDHRIGTYDATHLVFEVAEETDFKYKFRSIPDVIEPQVLVLSEKLSIDERKLKRAFAQVMLRFREQKRLTLRQLAKEAKLAFVTINDIENAKQGLRLSSAFRIAIALGKSPDDFLRLVVNEYLEITKRSPG